MNPDAGLNQAATAKRFSSLSEQEFSERALAIIERDSDGAYARFRALAKSIFLIPHAFMSLAPFDGSKLRVLTDDGVLEVPRKNSFCGCALEHSEIMVVQNATEDERFNDNAMVREKMHVRFYAGMPLVSSSGVAFGTLCIMDTIPRAFDESRVTILKDFAQQIVTLVQSEVIAEIQAEQLNLDTQILGGIDATRTGEGNRPRPKRKQAEPISIQDEVENVFDLFFDEANAKGVELGADIADDLALRFDREVFSLALRTAVFNGIKFCIYGGSVKVDAWKTARHILISVSDTGAGMEPERVQQILSSGVSADAVLGLIACRRLLEAEKGRIDILSEKGMGTSVTMTFPG